MFVFQSSSNRSLLISFFTTLLRASYATSLPFNRTECQAPTSNPLQGCPSGTLLVGANITNASSSFSTIQSAILSLPHDNSSATILMLPGIYEEQLNVTRPGPLNLLGQTQSPLNASSNTVSVLWHEATGNDVNTFDNAYTSVLTIAPTLESSLTGSGPAGYAVPANTSFGTSDFRAYNLDFTNDYLPYSAGPSLALGVSYANAAFYHTRFSSYQDTIYVGKRGNAYFHQCVIAGQTDFLYGFGTAWIENSTLLLRGCGGGITAWKGTNTTTPNKYGAYVHSSSVMPANSTIAADIKGKCSLGRPWNNLHRSIFAQTYLDEAIRSQGYSAWSSSEPRVDSVTFMAEFEDFGPGWNLEGRKAGNVTRVLTQEEWNPYSGPEKVFEDGTAWMDEA
ncbi:pectin lyase fold/virulence factor [Phyllosticta citriasiana]|uniref:pectinesterase n=1 Tax=Phyllosticta citriasiana TaxID=595635 RepID=A0ABR1KQ91_9PEZI